MFSEATEGSINFLPVSRDDSGFLSIDYFVNHPIRLLQEHSCETIFPLYSALGEAGKGVVNQDYFRSLKFDEYKYAITGVPFSEKWNLKIQRDREREEKIFSSVYQNKPYIVLHETAGDGEVIHIKIPDQIRSDFEIVTVDKVSDSIFDWITVFERASGLFMIDSAHANLVEQLNIGINKHLKTRSSVSFTPVFKNGWIFI